MLLLLAACALAPTPDPAPALPAEAPDPVDLTSSPDPFVLAGRLATADAKVLDPSVSDAEAARWGHAQQRILRTLADDGVLAGRVLDAMPDAPARTRAAALLHATRETGRATRPELDLPDWRIVAPRPAHELEAAYRAAAAAHGVPWSVLAAIHLHGTRMGRLRGASVADDVDAIDAAARALAGSGWAEDPDRAIEACHRGGSSVAAVKDVAAVLEAEPRAYRGLWGWQVYYRTVQGSIWLDEGYASDVRQPIEAWCATADALHCPKIH